MCKFKSCCFVGIMAALAQGWCFAGDDQQIQLQTSGGIEATTEAGDFSFNLGGRLMLDAAFYSDDQNLLGSGTELRRARIEVEGVVREDWGYEFAVDFAGGEAEVKDAYIEYRNLGRGKLLIGQYKAPFGLEELTSSKYITFMERALLTEFAPGRNIGVGYHTYRDSWTFGASVFGEGYNDDVDNEGDEGGGLATRFTYAPYHGDTQSLHFGVALAHRVLNTSKEIKFNMRPESHVTDVKYLNTGDISDTESVTQAGLEFAWVQGPFSVQSEWLQAKVDRRSGFDSPTFDGWYAYTSWFMTGESRNYKYKKGAFGKVSPNHGSAIELALRFSNMNLNDGSVTGGEQSNTTLGLNWYFNPQLRFMLNYLLIDNDEYADDDGDVLGNDEPSLLQLRLQLHF